jgi:predicted transposase/invertase (TIGR01784 family)
MQKKDLSYFAKRSLYYTSKAYVSQLSKGSEYESLKKVYFIGILNFTMFSNKDYVSRHLILNKETLKQEIDDFEFSFVELPKFNKQLSELNTILDKWIYFIKEAQNLDFIPKEFEDKKEFLEAFKIATQYTWNQEELDIYDYIAIKEYDEINAMETAKKKAREEGLKEGLEEGLQKGIQKGIKQGEEKKAIEIAKNLLKAGVDIDTVVISTGLDKKVIEELVGRI